MPTQGLATRSAILPVPEIGAVVAGSDGNEGVALPNKCGVPSGTVARTLFATHRKTATQVINGACHATGANPASEMVATDGAACCLPTPG